MSLQDEYPDHTVVFIEKEPGSTGPDITPSTFVFPPRMTIWHLSCVIKKRLNQKDVHICQNGEDLDQAQFLEDLPKSILGVKGPVLHLTFTTLGGHHQEGGNTGDSQCGDPLLTSC